MDKPRFWEMISNLTSIAAAGRSKFEFLRRVEEEITSFFQDSPLTCRLLDETQIARESAVSETPWNAAAEEFRGYLSSLPDDSHFLNPPIIFLIEKGELKHSPPSAPVPSALTALENTAPPDKTGSKPAALAAAPIVHRFPARHVLLFLVASPSPLSDNPGRFEEVLDLARSIGTALSVWQRSWPLNERIKELTCLYQMARLLDQKDNSLEDIFVGATEFIPPAWLYANSAAARVTFDGREYSGAPFPAGRQNLSADIVVQGAVRGKVEVCYVKEKPPLDEGPFLNEERELLEIIARELSLIAEGRLKEREMADLREQLQHANRLTMTGQIAAAVAHEINEPLTNIIGFSQLAAKTPRLPKTARSDLEKILATSLHAREIVRRLLTFSRKMPTKLEELDLNDVVEESLSFLGSRGANLGVTLDFKPFEQRLPVLGDAGRIRQVVFNLVINAIQAGGKGSSVVVSTARQDRAAVLEVVDSGPGIPQEIQEKIFIPFFSTKPPGQGAGLGLSVVKEIMDSYQGTIEFHSSPGTGTRAVATFPGLSDAAPGGAK